MSKFYTRNRRKPPGYAQKLLLRAKVIALIVILIVAVKQTKAGYITTIIDVKGLVMDTKGKPLAGATITVKGTGRSTKTNEKGEFFLKAVNTESLLTITFVGFKSQDINANNFVSVNLKTSVGELVEVEIVSTGYQKIDRNKITGSVAHLDNKLLNRSTSTGLVDRIKNMVPGVYFQDRNPQLSSISTYPTDKNSGITIRGQATFNASKEPLIILDNFPYEGEVSNINPNDVESITVLKDASAASIWGARSGNGVIVITTKKGKVNQSLKVDFNANITVIEKPDLKYDKNFLDSRSYIQVEQFLFDKGYFNSQLNDAVSFPIVSPAVELFVKLKQAINNEERLKIQSEIDQLKNLDVRDDYGNYIYQKAINQQYALSLRGGGEKMTYAFSLGNDNNRNNLINNGYNRTSVNSSNSFQPIKNLIITAGLNYSQNKTALNNNFGYGSFTTLGAPYNRIYPYAMFVNQDGTPASVLQRIRASYLESSKAKGFLDWKLRPLEEITFADHNTKVSDLILKLGVDYKIFPELSVQAAYQNEKQNISDRNLQSAETYNARNLINQFSLYDPQNGTITYNFPKGGLLDLANSEWISNNVRGQLTFQKESGKSNFETIIGTEIKELVTEGYSRNSIGYNEQFGSSVNFLNYTTNFSTNPSGSASLPTPVSNIQGFINRNISYYAIGTYDYDKKYVVNLSARKDGANLFGAKANDKFKPFLSAGIGWNISKEPFYNSNWLTLLRIRSSFGYQGNTYQNSSAFLTGTYTTDNLTGATGLLIKTAPNPRLRWERVRNTNIGLDFATKNNVINGTIEFYQKEGTDLVQPTTLPGQSGFATYLANTASTKTKGIDVSIQTQNFNKKFKWNSTFLFSAFKDKVVKYDVPFNSASISSVSYAVGKPLNSLFSYKWNGLNPLNGNPVGVLNNKASEDYYGIINNFSPDSLVYNGSQVPTIYGAIRNDFYYAGFSLSINISYRLGYFFRRSSTSLGYENLISSGQHQDYNLRWQKPGDERVTSVPSITYPGDTYRNAFYQNSEVLVEPGDHIRIQDIRLGYTVNTLGKSKFRLDNLTVFSYVNNIGTIWRKNKSNIDPSAYSAGSTQFKSSLSISLGVTANF